jgi:ABC-type phosphate transport system substrate-binding protein
MKKFQKLLVGFLALVGTSQVSAGAVVTGSDSPVAKIDAEEAKKLFLGREAMLGGQNVTVIFQREGNTRSDFETKILGKTGADLTAYWAKLVFTGKAQAPVEVGGDNEVKAKVGSTPGAVGYITDGSVDGSVKVLLKY